MSTAQRDESLSQPRRTTGRGAAPALTAALCGFCVLWSAAALSAGPLPPGSSTLPVSPGAAAVKPLPAAFLAAVANAAEARPAADPTDPVLAEVLRLLRGGVSEPVIVSWLDKSGKRPAAVTADDLVTLHKAGASEGLLKHLVELAGSQPPPPQAPPQQPSGPQESTPPPTAAPPATPAAPPTSPPPSAPPLAAPPAAPAPSARVQPPAAPAPAPPPTPAAMPAAASGEAVKVRFAVAYRPVFMEDEQPWALYLYVDGRFVAVVQAQLPIIPLPPRTFEREMAPGHHVLRLAEERHLRYNSVRGYTSPSRMDPNDFAFELQPGKPAEFKIHVGDTSLRRPGPVSVEIQQDGRQVANLEPAGTNSNTWPAVCEDVTASYPAGGKVPSGARRELERCLHWADLWPGQSAAPRAEVRSEIDRQSH